MSIRVESQANEKVVSYQLRYTEKLSENDGVTGEHEDGEQRDARIVLCVQRRVESGAVVNHVRG